MLDPVVSVIIPVYNAENTLDKTVHSLQKQTYRRLQIIFVNDCSTDNSLVKLFAYRTGNVTECEIIIESHEVNKGVAAARNTGLDRASGEYIYFVDADDFIEPNTIEVMVSKARSQDADIVGCNWYLSFEKNEREMSQRSFSTALEALQNILRGVMRWNLWLFMVKRSLYEENRVRFVPGQNMGEDLYIMVQLFLAAKQVAHIPQFLYHYWEGNPNSLTNNYSDRHIEEVDANVKKTEAAILGSSYSSVLMEEINYMKLNIKLPLLISDDVKKYQHWFTWFAEANGSIFKNPSQSLRMKVVQYLALKKQYWGVKLYYYLVVKFVYGIIYK